MLRPKKHGGSFGFQCIVANMVGGDATVVACIKCENPYSLPPFPTWKGVLATEIGDPGMMDAGTMREKWC